MNCGSACANQPANTSSAFLSASSQSFPNVTHPARSGNSTSTVLFFELGDNCENRHMER